MTIITRGVILLFHRLVKKGLILKRMSAVRYETLSFWYIHRIAWLNFSHLHLWFFTIYFPEPGPSRKKTILIHKEQFQLLQLLLRWNNFCFFKTICSCAMHSKCSKNSIFQNKLSTNTVKETMLPAFIKNVACFRPSKSLKRRAMTSRLTDSPWSQRRPPVHDSHVLQQ